ncbi:hypothetical protein [Bdellovibrio sp. HCB2-146]|uniref:hypothetical protein n=1 Tax=Bdellovibrio sp. HCB2-146 TaxID=3394362 RepID=UPI0039BC7D95
MRALILALSLLSTAPAFANVPTIKPCTAKGLAYLQEFVAERAADAPSTAHYMVSASNQVVGVYVWDHDGLSAYGQICEIIDVPDDQITASTWYYWESDLSSNPATWPLHSEHSLAQDEGRSYLKVLTTAPNGDITIEFKVVGWGETEDEIIFRSEVLRLVK